jgi:hypothetical protein
MRAVPPSALLGDVVSDRYTGAMHSGFTGPTVARLREYESLFDRVGAHAHQIATKT